MTLPDLPPRVSGRTRFASCLAGVVVLFCTLSVSAADSPVSPAEQRVFLDDHLQGVASPAVLRYRFNQTGTLDKPFDGDVVLTIKAKDRDNRVVEVAYLSGERKVTLPAVESAKANPVILYFLEQDVREMHRRLGGSENYFRRRIRLAFADGAEVHPASVVVDGRTIAADEVVIRPFVDDPMKAKLGPFEGKSYAFVLSDQVPGGVVRLQSRVAAPATGPAPATAGPLLEDVLSFDKVAK